MRLRHVLRARAVPGGDEVELPLDFEVDVTDDLLCLHCGSYTAWLATALRLSCEGVDQCAPVGGCWLCDGQV